MSQPSLFADQAPACLAPGQDAPSLRTWNPDEWPIAPDWRPWVERFLSSSQGQSLADFIRSRLALEAPVYPPQPFRALELTALAEVRVVIVGQDPYHGPGQAEGLAFSVPQGVRPPPSLANIHRELVRDGLMVARPANGSLAHWARQGVLLLNTCLTVEGGRPASHAGKGWEALTSSLIQTINSRATPALFMLWGAHAQRFVDSIDPSRHRVLTANHPSPLSALRRPAPFIGCGHFRIANEWLESIGQPPIRWDR